MSHWFIKTGDKPQPLNTEDYLDSLVIVDHFHCGNHYLSFWNVFLCICCSLM